MILKESEIKSIIEKKGKVIKSGVIEYNYTMKEQLDLLQTYIFEKKKIDVGEIKEPQGKSCGHFIHFMINKGMNPIDAMQRGNDYNLFDYMLYFAFTYYINKFKE